ncbi:DEAD/DEAH box helicase [Nitrosarchaeum sp.]|uniref:DEAD/DEAH box helicase n=1 Tax=Nitrosarchaeum sp. TaxID=2026886 RepID=UPI00247DB688|nr:DEAD/DEAH box helicase [Nitrosarchaeum sp.]MCV0411382.1 DEAD/DEAH box helicase [Nitrosarchaeum sp.]
MSRFNLSPIISSKIFLSKEEKDEFNAIRNLLKNDTVDILLDPEICEELYLNLNPKKFKDKNFRIKLLRGAFGNKQFSNFVSKSNLKMISKTSPTSQKEKFVNKIAMFQWGDNDITKAFVNAFELDLGLIPENNEQKKDYEFLEKPITSYSPLFNYQFKIYDEANEELKYDSSRFLIQIPTGGGKTKIAMEIVTNFLNTHNDAIVIWLADKKELLEQADIEFKKIWAHRGTKDLHLNRVWGDNYKFKENIEGSKIIIFGISKLMNFLKNNKKVKADLIIFDEAHHAAAKKYNKALEEIGKFEAKYIGLTATPGRGQEEENKKLAALFNDKRLTINTDNYQSPISYLQELGVLSKLSFKKPIIIPEIDFELTISEMKAAGNVPEEYDEKLLRKIGHSHIRNVRIIKKILELNEQRKQILYFGPSVEQSRLMYILLKDLGKNAEFVDSHTPPELRTEIITKFREKKINILLNYNVFTTGFDAPVVDTVFISRPTKSPNTLLQMIGRGMRGPNVKDGTEFCDIVYVQDEFLAQFQNFEELYRIYDQYYERE